MMMDIKVTGKKIKAETTELSVKLEGDARKMGQYSYSGSILAS
jgi:hypothetical protein